MKLDRPFHGDVGLPFLPPLDPFIRGILLDQVAKVRVESTGDWDSHLDEVVRLGLAGAALARARATDAEPSDSSLASLRAAARNESARALALEGIIPELAHLFEAHEIPWLLVKGPTLSRLDPRLAARAFGDLDVMVAPSDVERAAGVLVEAGFSQELDGWEPRKDLPYRYRHSVGFRRGRLAIDLHQVIPPTVYGRSLTFMRLWKDARLLRIAGQDVRAPSFRHATMIAALHVLSSGGGLWARPWRDAAVLLSAEQDTELLWAEIRACGMAMPVMAVARSLSAGWDVSVPVLQCAKGRGATRLSFRLWAMDWRRSWSNHQLAEIFMMPFTWAVRFLLAFAFPDRRSVANRYGIRRQGIAIAYVRWWWDLGVRFSRVLLGQRVEPRLPDSDRVP